MKYASFFNFQIEHHVVSFLKIALLLRVVVIYAAVVRGYEMPTVTVHKYNVVFVVARKSI